MFPSQLCGQLLMYYFFFLQESPIPSLVLPPHVQWFDMNFIHDYEKQGLPDFFTEQPTHPSKTAAVYKEYRDFMINVYQQNPDQYLTVTACRRNLSGDAAAILRYAVDCFCLSVSNQSIARVHDFLEQVGLINFAIQPDTASIFPPPAVPDPSEAIQQLFKLDPVNSSRVKQVHSNLQTRKYILSEQTATLARVRSFSRGILLLSNNGWLG